MGFNYLIHIGGVKSKFNYTTLLKHLVIERNRTIFIADLANYVKKTQYNGVYLTWYRGQCDDMKSCSANERDELTIAAFLRELRKELDDIGLQSSKIVLETNIHPSLGCTIQYIYYFFSPIHMSNFQTSSNK